MSSRKIRETIPYYLGLDIGTDSVGWAVTDQEYNVLKFNGKAMWGVRLFDEAETAASRRLSRVSRRRTERRAQRLALLQDLFTEEINRVDPGFFMRLSESPLYHDDKTVDQSNTLFHDPDYADRDFHKDYPTIYHLRKALIESDQPFDVRLVYLAIHHILKYRGHFLFEGDLTAIQSLPDILAGFDVEVQDTIGVPFACNSIEAMQDVLLNEKIRMTQKQKELNRIFDARQPEQKAMIKLLSGGKISIKDLFSDISAEEVQQPDLETLDFKSGKYEDNSDKLEALLGERFYILQKLKAIYDWALLSNTLKGKDYLSFAKVDVYQKHQADLKRLKKIVKTYAPDKYKAVFQSANTPNNYCAYVGMTKKNGRKLPIDKKCSQEDLCKYLSGILKSAKNEADADLLSVLKELELRTLLPKIVSRDNGVIPHQVHEAELRAILANAEGYLPFLSEKDDSGLTVSEKILQIFRFRIPYYVGPLNDRNPNAQNCWVVRRSHDKIYPWNFSSVVDMEQSAVNFITRMTAQCTYFHDEKVLPANSVAYCRFAVLNQLNNLKICGDKVSVETKQSIFNDLFLRHNKVTTKQLLGWFRAHGQTVSKDDLSGFDAETGFTSGMRPYIELKQLLGNEFSDERADEIVRLITVFGEDRKMLRSQIRSSFGSVLSEEQIGRLLTKRYSGWGRLSRKFLKGFIAPIPELQGREMTILDAMWETNNNLNELLSGSYAFSDFVRRYNMDDEESGTLKYQSVRDLYVSPAVKRQIWQAVSVVEEIQKIMKHDPEKTFIEMARGAEEKKRTESRKNKLLDLYRNCKDDARDWVSEIEKLDESDLRRDRLYLYYTQMGKCVYTGEKIEISQLFDANVYDIDHIYPQSRTKDDSLDNRVLSLRTFNSKKSDTYPLPEEVRARQHTYWSTLRQRGLISQEKYNRLTRNSNFTEKELAGFINRQLVETRQSTKAVADILSSALKQTEIVYVKAGLVSDFRRDYDMLKCREVNDLHHAKDAYLNIVVGNVYHTKFTHDPRNFFAEANRSYSMNRMFDFDVVRGGVTAWIGPKRDDQKRIIPGQEGTITQIQRVMRKNNILVTRLAFERHGALFDATLMKKGKGQLPLHGTAGSPFLNISRYGGYNKVAGAYYTMIAYRAKGREERDIVDVPLHRASELRSHPAAMTAYLQSLGYDEPRIVIPEIRIQSRLEINGFPMRITGRTGPRYLCAPASQLILSYDEEVYIRNIVKFNQRAAEYKRSNGGAELKCNPYDQVNPQDNLALYDTLMQKLEQPCYKEFLNSALTNMRKGRPAFAEIPVEDQCFLLEEILHFFACNRTIGDLSLLKLPKSCGIVTISSQISKYDSAFLICQSVTGLFEQRIDLLR